jgi:magnesium-transporting ATPase (P-type)
VISAFCTWLSATAVSGAFQASTWFVPTVQTVHILSVAILLITVFVMSLRLIGLPTGRQPLAELIRSSSNPIWVSLAVLLLTGILLTITEPARELLNWMFRAKMLLVTVLAILVWWLQKLNLRALRGGGRSLEGGVTARVMGFVLILVGTAIVTAGRWIAYVA